MLKKSGIYSKITPTSALVEAARLYYEHQFSQQQIADKLGVSRPGVSRLLQEARERGIVRIEIIDPADRGTALEIRLKDKFGLKQAIVVPGDDDQNLVKSRLGKTGAALLAEIASPGLVLGVSWGTTMMAVARNLQPQSIRDMIVVQLNGGVSHSANDTHASEVAQKTGMAFGAMTYLLPLPAVVDKKAVKDAVLSDKNIIRTLETARSATVAMYTIGNFDRNSVLIKSGYFESSEVDALLQSGAVGDICSRIIDTSGNICSPELDARTIGIDLTELQQKEYTIAVAGGKVKVAAIRAALTGKLLNVLITDEAVAAELLF